MINANLVIGIVTLVITAIAWWESRRLGRLSGIFVDYTLMVMAVLSVITFIRGLLKSEKISLFESKSERISVLTGGAILALYLFLMPWLGFLVTSYLFYAVFNWYLGENRREPKYILSSITVSLVVVTGFFLVFRYVLNIPLPRGSWFE